MRAHRRGPLEHVLVAGDLEELGAIHALLAFLPEHAYGQVYVETPADRQLPPLPAPARVTVTRVPRPAGAEPGALLAQTVTAWVAEWLPEEADERRTVSMWVGATATRGPAQLDAVRMPLERL
jgi:NADPH-dependent ferric siderophore reductase